MLRFTLPCEPGSYRALRLFPDDNTTLVTVSSGDLEISGNGFSQVLHGGQSMKLSGDQELQARSPYSPGDDDFDRWANVVTATVATWIPSIPGNSGRPIYAWISTI